MKPIKFDLKIGENKYRNVAKLMESSPNLDDLVDLWLTSDQILKRWLEALGEREKIAKIEEKIKKRLGEKAKDLDINDIETILAVGQSIGEVFWENEESNPYLLAWSRQWENAHQISRLKHGFYSTQEIEPEYLKILENRIHQIAAAPPSELPNQNF